MSFIESVGFGRCISNSLSGVIKNRLGLQGRSDGSMRELNILIDVALEWITTSDSP